MTQEEEKVGKLSFDSLRLKSVDFVGDPAKNGKRAKVSI